MAARSGAHRALLYFLVLYPDSRVYVQTSHHPHLLHLVYLNFFKFWEAEGWESGALSWSLHSSVSVSTGGTRWRLRQKVRREIAPAMSAKAKVRLEHLLHLFSPFWLNEITVSANDPSIPFFIPIVRRI